MKKLVLAIALLSPFSTLANTFIEKNVNGYRVKVIEYDLSSKIYDIKVIKTDDATSLGDLLEKNNAITGVNGVFFCPVDYDWCNTKKSFTDNERYIAGEKFASYLTTGDRAVFAWTKDKKPFIYQSGKINPDDEDKIYYGLGNYPLILNEGKNMLEYYYDVGLIFPKLIVQDTRNFICSNKEKTHIYFGLVYKASIDELAWVLSDFGCWDALNLDAGISLAFVYNGKYIAGPGRDILDSVAIERIGFDTKKSSEISSKIFELLLKRSENKSKHDKKKQINFLESYSRQIDNLRSKIYSKYSTDIVETNSLTGEKEKVGYKIEIDDLKTLKIVYVLNKVNNLLKLKIKELKKEAQKNVASN